MQVKKFRQMSPLNRKTYIVKASQDTHNIQLEEILKEGIPSALRHFTHYYMSNEDDSSSPSNHYTMAKPNRSQPINQFLKFLQITNSMFFRVRSESLIDYRHSQTLSSTNHVDILKQILKKKARIEEKRATERELIKARREEERVDVVVAKQKKVAKLEAEKIDEKN